MICLPNAGERGRAFAVVFGEKSSLSQWHKHSGDILFFYFLHRNERLPTTRGEPEINDIGPVPPLQNAESAPGRGTL